MPELPEVETIRRGLEKFLVGHRIERIKIHVPKIFPGGSRSLIGGKITAVRRFGKVIVVDLDNGYSFLVHLKMTGQLIYYDSSLLQPQKYTHVIFSLDKGVQLLFNDVRKFGWIKVEKTAEVGQNSFVGKLGPEPFDLTTKKFSRIIFKSKKPIKLLLMDQEKISGIGNIYANDALWLAGINPQRLANSLTDQEVKKLFTAIKKVLNLGIKYQGASDQWYLTSEGKKGNYQKHFLVYGQEGRICPRCRKTTLTKMFLGGRGTYLCRYCQK